MKRDLCMQQAKIKLTCVAAIGLLLCAPGLANTNQGHDVLGKAELASDDLRKAVPGKSDQGYVPSLVVNDYVLVRKQSRRADTGRAIFAVTEFEIDYQNNRLTRFSEYPNGIDDLTANAVFEFDQGGNLISQLDIDAKGTSSRKEFVYDEAGQLVNFNGFMASNGNQNSAWQYYYREDGKLDRKVEFSGEPAKAKAYEYSDQGSLISVTHQRGSRNGTFQTTYIERFEHHRKTGQITRQESFSPDGKSFGVSSTYHYDKHGNMVRIEWFKGAELTHTDQFFYALKRKPVFNYWLHISRFFPEWMRYEV